jgi:hypothetical protein
MKYRSYWIWLVHNHIKRIPDSVSRQYLYPPTSSATRLLIARF